MNDEIKWALRGIHARFDYLERVLARQGRNEEISMAAIDDLQAEVARNTTVEQSALTLITGLSSQLVAAIASGDMTQVQAVADTLKANDDALAAAVAANTPAAPPPAPAPVPAP